MINYLYHNNDILKLRYFISKYFQLKYLYLFSDFSIFLYSRKRRFNSQIKTEKLLKLKIYFRYIVSTNKLLSNS